MLRKREAQKPLVVREDVVNRTRPGEMDVRKDLR